MNKKVIGGQHGDYEELLNAFGANRKSNAEAVKHLESLGFRNGQARSAVYQYRKKAGLVNTKVRNPPSLDSRNTPEG